MGVRLGLLRVCVALTVASCPACFRAGGQGSIVRGYRAAACVVLSATPSVTPPTREWSSPQSLPGGVKVVIRGAAIPGGRVTLFYPQTGNTVIAADAGDYVYPTDIRLDAKNALLYVKARGLAGGLSLQTWLFEYDIQQRRLLQRQMVHDADLPEECE